MVMPFIIGTHNSKNMLHRGVDVFRAGGLAIEAVEAATNAVEENPEDSSVGLGGLPNMLGVPQMDASIMDGDWMRARHYMDVDSQEPEERQGVWVKEE